MHSSSRGFTLIELLVVIAIIGILAVVSLASLLVARYKAADAAIKSDIHTAQTHVEYYYSNQLPSTYGTAYGPLTTKTTVSGSCSGCVFTADPNVLAALQAAVTQSGSGGYWAVGVGGASWAMAVPLKNGGANSAWWCADSSGSAQCVAGSNMTGQALGGGGSAAQCPAKITCP